MQCQVPLFTYFAVAPVAIGSALLFAAAQIKASLDPENPAARIAVAHAAFNEFHTLDTDTFKKLRALPVSGKKNDARTL